MDGNNDLTLTPGVSKGIELFTFGSNQKLKYEDFCKVVVNGFSQLLVIETGKADYFVPFNRQYISKNNVLLILAPKQANDLALYFSKKDSCQKLFDTITNYKAKTTTTIVTPDQNRNEILFNERFGKPLFNETFSSGNLRLKSIFEKVMLLPDTQPLSPTVIKNPENHSVLKRLLNEKVVQQEKAQNLKITKIEKDNNKVMQSPITTLNPFTFNENRETITTSLDADKNQTQLTSHKSATDIECSNKFKRNTDFVDNCSNVNAAATITDNNGTSSNKMVVELNNGPPRKKQKLNDNIFTEDSIKRPSENEFPSFADKFIINRENFEIHSSFKKGSEKYILIIPNSINKNLCYRYGFNPLHKQFSCGYCRANHKISVTATLNKTHSGEFYIEQNRAHECSLLTLKSSDKNKKLLKADEYEKLLSKDFIQCSSSNSKIINESNSSGLHETENDEIKNILKQNVSENMTDDNSNFDREEENKKVLTFLSKENNQINSSSNLIINTPNFKLGQTEKGKGQKVTAKLCKSIKNEDYVLLNNDNHVCDPQLVEDGAIPPERIIKNGNFKFYASTHRNPYRKLEITHSNGNKYFYNRSNNKIFICGKCQRQAGLNVTARICQTQNQEPYLILNENEHICQKYEINIQKFLQKNDDSTKNKNTVEAACQPKAHSEVPSKIEFEIFPDSKGISNSKLIIFDGNDFTKGRDYHLENGLFKCAECFVKGKLVTAKLIETEDGEKYIELGSEQHVCEIPNLSSQGRALKIRKLDETPKEIIVPYFADRKFYYKFVFNQDLKVFHCQRCKEAGINVCAKIATNQNDQPFLILNNQHFCSPILASELQN